MTNIQKKASIKENLKIDPVEILSEHTKKDIEKSYNLENVKGTEAYYSNRYGWTLRKSLD
tara:strand:+ start:156 stop:335 length:180 start_codon:yes stop_codon:yes gene_type:complete